MNCSPIQPSARLLAAILAVAAMCTAGRATEPAPSVPKRIETFLQALDAGTIVRGQHENAALHRPGQCGITFGCCCDYTSAPRFRLSELNIYPTFSYRGTLSATYTEFEFASDTDLGWFEMENRTVLNVADLPDTIRLGPTNPGEDPTPMGVRANGLGDILSGFFFSPQGHESNLHLGIGPVVTFPTASNSILGSEQWTIGPGAHFSAHMERLTAGFFIWQSWKFAGSSSQKRINQLFGKPFIIYEMTEDWHLVYIPLGMSHSWEAPQGDDWTVPIGGGIRKLFCLGGQRTGLQFQAFDYVARKPNDPEWELRATIEFLFD